VLQAILAGCLTVKEGGSKNSLAPRTRVGRREKAACDICYLRDRDFDHDPPTDTSRPQIDHIDADGSVLGWRWCRHEIENYLIDPEFAALAKGWDRGEYSAALTAAAQQIRHYQVARWAVGTVRRQLRPPHHLQTRPRDCGNAPYRLPSDLSEEGTTSWAHAQTECFRAGVDRELSSQAIQTELESRRRTLTEQLLASPGNALLWCSGKDLLAALEPWLAGRGVVAPSAFVAQVRDWVRADPERALGIFPEWQALVLILTA
jgi:hypothetical protein